jgi:prevent-host-death family protein
LEPRVPVRELNQHTSRVLKQVMKGQAVTITLGGRPVARLVPISDPPSVLEERLVTLGLATPPSDPSPFPPPAEPGDARLDVAARIARDRSDERA